MDDRVGELLAERARIGGGAGGGIALSVLLHGSIAAAAVYAAMHASAPQQVSALNIRFAPMPSSRESQLVAPTPDPRPPLPKNSRSRSRSPDRRSRS